MLTIPNLNESDKAIKNSIEKLRKLNADVAADIRRINSEGRSSDWVGDESGRTRTKAREIAHETYGGIIFEHDKIRHHEKLWSSRELVLSTLPVTRRGADGLTPDNPHLENATRMRTLEEAKRLAPSQLKLFAENAIADGQYGKAYLYQLEYQTRPKEQPGERGIDLSGFEIPEQVTALKIFNSARAAVDEGLLILKEIDGKSKGDLLINRLTLAHTMNDGGK
jgi:hypothetical protein